MPPLFDVSIEPKCADDTANMLDALGALAVYDPLFSFHADVETGQIILHFTSDAHLDGHIEAMHTTFQIDVLVGAKQVAYRESLGSVTEIKYTYKKLSGGSGQFAEVSILFEPLARNSGVVFESRIGVGVLPRGYVLAVENGIRTQAETGVLAGFPTIDFKFTLVDAKYHDLDSTPFAFENAAKACFLELRKIGSPKILEPVMKVDILAPEIFVGDIVGSLMSRRGQLRTATKLGRMSIITAVVPLKEMFDYGDVLAGVSQDRARYVMHYDGHEVVPRVEPPDDLFPSAMAMRA